MDSWAQLKSVGPQFAENKGNFVCLCVCFSYRHDGTSLQVLVLHLHLEKNARPASTDHSFWSQGVAATCSFREHDTCRAAAGGKVGAHGSAGRFNSRVRKHVKKRLKDFFE